MGIKSKVTDKTKVVFGVIVIIFGVLLLGLLGVKFIFSIILIALPAILLVIPSDNIKNSEIIGIILIIWLIINLLGYLGGIIDPYSYFESHYDFITAGYQFSGNDMYYFREIEMLENYTFFCCLMMFIYTFINIIGSLLFFAPTVKQNNANNIKINNSYQAIVCPNCGNNLKEGSKFCSFCGENLEDKKITCPKCGEQIDKGSKFCSICGENLNDENKSCQNCGEILDAGDEFCPNCGNKI